MELFSTEILVDSLFKEEIKQILDEEEKAYMENHSKMK